MRRFVVVAVLVGLAAAACSGGDEGDDAGDGAGANPPPLPRGENTELVISMLDRLNSARDATYKVVYEFSGLPSEGVPQGTLTIVQRPPQQRTEVVGGETDPAIAFVGDDSGTVACASAVGPSGYQCYETSAFIDTSTAAVSSSDLLAIADDLRKAQQYYSFSESSTEIAGVDARCLTATATSEITDQIKANVGESVEVCTTEDGIPVVVETRGSSAPLSVRARELTTSVSDTDFDPPAVVQAGAPNFQAPQPPETVPEGES